MSALVAFPWHTANSIDRHVWVKAVGWQSHIRALVLLRCLILADCIDWSFSCLFLIYGPLVKNVIFAILMYIATHFVLFSTLH